MSHTDQSWREAWDHVRAVTEAADDDLERTLRDAGAQDAAEGRSMAPQSDEHGSGVPGGADAAKGRAEAHCDLEHVRQDALRFERESYELIAEAEAERDELRAVVERVRALRDRWEADLSDHCPLCLASLNPRHIFRGCDHEEGYHHALADLRAALDDADQDREAQP